MKPKTKIAIWVLAPALVVAVLIAIWIPSSVDFGSVDFFIEDTNNDYQYEVGESLNFTLSDSSMNDRSIVWGHLWDKPDVVEGQRPIEKYHIAGHPCPGIHQ